MSRKRPTTNNAPFIVPEYSLMGWCNTGHHDQCPTQVVHWASEGNTKPTKCKCNCHKAAAPKKIRKKND